MLTLPLMLIPPSFAQRTASLGRDIVTSQAARQHLDELFGESLHVKRVRSLADGVVGILHAAQLGVSVIGRAMAAQLGLEPKHAIKQFDRLLSNQGIQPWDLFAPWVTFVLGDRPEAVVILDWTDFHADGHKTCMASLVTTHGRATPLVWKTVPCDAPSGTQRRTENEILDRLQELIPRSVRLTLLADRGFGDVARYSDLESMGWDFVIRFRANVLITDAQGVCKPARDRIPTSGRAVRLSNVEVTTDKEALPAVVLVRKRGMKEAWVLATSRTDLSAAQVVKLYGRRFTIEETFRDQKDPRFGYGLKNTRLGSPERRDRMLLLFALADALLVLLGAAAEAVGLDRRMKSNTSKKRAHSLLHQGQYWFSALPQMPEAWLRLLMEKFDELIREQGLTRLIVGVL